MQLMLPPIFRNARPVLTAIAWLMASPCACFAQEVGSSPSGVLPWIEHKLEDPFEMEQKAKKQIAPRLRPDSCDIPDLKRKLTLDDVVISALCNNPDTRSAFMSLVAQAANYLTNYSRYTPNISGSVSRSRTTSISDTTHDTSISGNYGLSLGLLLYDFGQREFSIEQAELAFLTAGQNFNATMQGTIAAALQGYYSLLNAQNSVMVAKLSEKFAQESYEAAVLRHEIGQVPLADELQSKASYSGAKLSVVAAENGLALQQASLAQLIGFPPDTKVEVSDIDNKTLGKDPFGGNIRSLMDKAKQQRYDLQSARNSLKSSEISLRALKRANTASISATTNMSVSNDDGRIFSRTSSRSQGVGVSVSIPIFTGFNLTYRERSAEKSLEAQRETLINTERSVERDVWNSWHNYETAKSSWATNLDQIATATQLKDVALGRYKEGLGSILDVLNAQLQYSSALQGQLQTRNSLLTSRVDLIRSVGVLDLESMNPESSLDSSPQVAENRN